MKYPKPTKKKKRINLLPKEGLSRFYKGDLCDMCSKPITYKNKTGRCRSCQMLGNKNTLGWKMPESIKKKLSIARLSSNNPNWKGDKVGYSALHGWIKRRLNKPEKCQKCDSRKVDDLANKGIYDRNFENWEWLCRKCHMLSDGRMKNFVSYRKNLYERTITC